MLKFMSTSETVSCNKSRVLYITPNMPYNAARRRGSRPGNASTHARSDPTTVVARRRVTPGLGVFWQMVCICYWETQISITFTSIHTHPTNTERISTRYINKADPPKLFHARSTKDDSAQKNKFAAALHSWNDPGMKNMRNNQLVDLQLTDSFQNSLVQYQLRSCQKWTVRQTSSCHRPSWIQYDWSFPMQSQCVTTWLPFTKCTIHFLGMF